MVYMDNTNDLTTKEVVKVDGIQVIISWIAFDGTEQETVYDLEDKVNMLEFVEHLIDSGLRFEVGYNS